MILTRRIFFRNLIDNVVENIQDSIPSVMSNIKSKEEVNKPETWVLLGNISDFPVGISLPVNNQQHVLVSKSEGIFVLDFDTFNSEKKEPRRLIQMEERGIISMNPNQVSPVGTILSILTGNLVIEEEEL